MKFIALFFSIYMIVLAVMPCRDQQDKYAAVKLHSIIEKSHSCATECGQETCSPFCTCTCCSTVRVLQQPASSGLAEVLVYQSYPSHPIPALQQISLSVWQPPQIA